MIEQLDSKLSYSDIEKLIPHRYPFLLVDKITDIKKGNSIIAIKSVSGNEPFFPGHFPGFPIFPGVLIVEAMAQAASCLAKISMSSNDKNTLFYLASIDKTKFKKPLFPGNLLTIYVEKKTERSSLWKFVGRAKVNDELICISEFSAMIGLKDGINK